ncbi:MAG TPA: ABC transporter ATP-binding protein [Solirubrobacteraceae bacterium]|nr:ABC transporter ATP-binding protein [Solirubrobacteraceae bacterium]
MAEQLPHVAVRRVSKSFRIPEQRVHTLKERALHPRRKTAYQTFQALRDISLAVQPGEFFGIAGRNGSGKSTLLKCMAGIYQFDGDIWVRGRLSTFIELGVGFNMDLAARDNVIMNGLMMGLSPREARRRYDSVIEFAELQDFKDLKLKNYSSGMQVRLAFSVAIQVDAEILLIDEVLAVGDASFQQKCFDVFNQMRDEGKTIVFVTHDMSALRRFCHRAVLLERGSMVHLGEPKDVTEQYLEINFGRDPEALERGEHAGDGDARVIEAWIENEQEQRTQVVPQGQRITLRVMVRFMVPVDDPQCSVYVHNEDQQAVLVASSWVRHERSGSYAPGETVMFSFSFDNVLAPGRYSPVINLAHRGSGLDVIDRYERGFSFLVSADVALGGVIDLPTEVSIERVGPGVTEGVEV